jgi:polyferredoxin
MKPRSLDLSTRGMILLKKRGWQVAFSTVMLAGLAFTAVAGWIGTPIGSRNFAIAFVWIGWFAALIILLIPIFGRGWCSICPIPMVGDWAQRGAVLGPQGRAPRGLGLRVPAILRNMWTQNAAFALLALFSASILTSPYITALALVGMFVLATSLSLVFERRAFCRYVCPMGGFIGLYSQVAPIELRVASRETCAACSTKACYNGSANGYGCPWGVFPASQTRNNYCGLCLECLRTCPNDNLTVRLRPVAADLAVPLTRRDEGFKSLIMLGSAMVYAAVLLGPWSAFKNAAFSIGSLAWLAYATVFLVLVLGLLPGSLWLVGRLSQRLTLSAVGTRANSSASARSPFAAFATPLVPLGLAFWAAFSLTFFLTNGSYVLSSISDPLGLGWNLIGTAGVAWQPMLAGAIAPLQTAVLVGGFIWAARVARRVTARLQLPTLPLIGFLFLPTVVMMWLLI